MTISSSVKLAGAALSVCGRTVLSGVPDTVLASSAAAGGAVDGIFVGADFPEADSRHVVSLGTLRLDGSRI
jgi:raffinose synthase